MKCSRSRWYVASVGRLEGAYDVIYACSCIIALDGHGRHCVPLCALRRAFRQCASETVADANTLLSRRLPRLCQHAGDAAQYACFLLCFYCSLIDDSSLVGPHTPNVTLTLLYQISRFALRSDPALVRWRRRLRPGCALLLAVPLQLRRLRDSGAPPRFLFISMVCLSRICHSVRCSPPPSLYLRREALLGH